MTFKLNETPNDLVDTITALRDAEQDGRKSAELRATLNQAAVLLDACRTQMLDAAENLELAAELRAGMMDSQSRSDEVARIKNQTLLQHAVRFRLLLTQHTQVT